MNSPTMDFGRIDTLSTIKWTIERMRNTWKWKDRSMDTVMRKFIDLNQQALDYLGISAKISSDNGRSSHLCCTCRLYRLTTSSKCGLAQLRSCSRAGMSDLPISIRFYFTRGGTTG